MNKKDFFSGHSKLYATFRPTYPDDLYSFVFKHVKEFNNAWDCATGNGQVARVLAKQFKHVCATDISQQQLNNAVQASNISYSVQSAEQTSFEVNQFDLIAVGQALHWFDLEKFFEEVKRVAKKNALLAVWGYSTCTVNSEIDQHFNHFYNHVVGPYWDSARRMVEEEYAHVRFPFDLIPAPKFSLNVEWTLDEFAGYLTTWSATQKFIKDKNYNPVPEVVRLLTPLWREKRFVSFPVFLKMGKI
ncbi:MAG: class I SAM-dependent methyltransferase [Cyclobacteriaceae bacterium]